MDVKGREKEAYICAMILKLCTTADKLKRNEVLISMQINPSVDLKGREKSSLHPVPKASYNC